MRTSFLTGAGLLAEPTGFAPRFGTAYSPPVEEQGGQSPIGFALFIALNAVLLIRPSEIVPALIGVPVYEWLILACLAFSAPAIVTKFRTLNRQPITLCVLALLPAVALSHLSHGRLGAAFELTEDFAKSVVYYILFISLIDTIPRLRCFLFCLVGFTVVLSALALLQYYDVINIQTLAQTQQREWDEDSEEYITRLRLCSTGLYHDPNDLCLILSTSILACLYWITDRGMGLVRFLWAAPIVLFGYCLALTQSRGGLLGLVAGLLTLFQARFGWRKAVLLAAAVLPVVGLLFAGRQTDIDFANPEDTGRMRVELWKEGIELFKQAPLFGIGRGEYDEEVGHVAHNSFVHCYTELGVFGGTLFTGVFFFSLWWLYRAGPAPALPGEVARLRPYLFAAVVAYVGGMLSLSRSYIPPTYMIAGLACSYLNLPVVRQRIPFPRLGPRVFATLLVVSGLVMVAIYVFVRVVVR